MSAAARRFRHFRLWLKHGSQWWFWTPEWQAMEREADEDSKAGRGWRYQNAEDFLNGLDCNDHQVETHDGMRVCVLCNGRPGPGIKL